MSLCFFMELNWPRMIAGSNRGGGRTDDSGIQPGHRLTLRLAMEFSQRENRYHCRQFFVGRI